MSELKQTSSWAKVDNDTANTMCAQISIKDVMDFRDTYKTYKK